jgi:uncharacterized protein (DUF2141 family)
MNRRLRPVGRALLLGALVVASAAAAGDAAGGTLRVHVTGLREAKGNVLVQLANSRQDYESDDDAFRYLVLPADGAKEMTAVFENVPAGEYAVKFFHDVNGNRKIDMGWRGPTEAYGFSNNAMGLFGPPDYDKAKFTFDGAEKTIEINAR